MAELALKIGDGPRFDDGDILDVFPRRRVRCCHAQHICHVRTAARNSDGLILLSHQARDWFEHTHQYRFERVSRTEVKRVALVTGVEELFGPHPNANGECMDVPLFIARRKARPEHYLFGQEGAEIWYLGNIDMSHAALDKVWRAIETKTPHREVDHQHMNLGQDALRSFLFLPTEDFTDAEAESLVAEELDRRDPEKPVLIRKRSHQVRYRELAGVRDHLSSIEDRSVAVDLRGSLPALEKSEARQKPDVVRDVEAVR